jgi:AcrR family transcriptional regulator
LTAPARARSPGLLGVNEALSFRRFRTKEGLFWAALSDRVERRGRNRRVRELLQSESNFRELLVAIAEILLTGQMTTLP